MMDERNVALRNFLPGLILIALGALFLADNFFNFNFSWVFRTWWPTLLIAFGMLQLINRPHRPVGALILIGLGVIFQVNRLHLFPWWSMRRLWPVILIVIGVGMLLSRLQRGAFGPAPPDGGPSNPGGDSSSHLSSYEVKS
jgi:hypothetical protein